MSSRREDDDENDNWKKVRSRDIESLLKWILAIIVLPLFIYLLSDMRSDIKTLLINDATKASDIKNLKENFEAHLRNIESKERSR